jgi:hypothetical protein
MWATKAARRRGDRDLNGEPSTSTSPVWSIKPAAERSNDDFPAPFGPIKHSHSPGCTVSEKLETAQAEL